MNVHTPYKRREGQSDLKSSFECTISYRNEKDIATALLRTNRQIHSEVEPTLYQNYTFDFDKDLSVGTAFLKSISQPARLSIRSVSMVLLHWHQRSSLSTWGVKKVKDWTILCQYIAKNLRLQRLTFDTFVKAVPKNFKSKAWVQALIKIQGLQELEQYPSNNFWERRRQMRREGEPDEEPNNILKARLKALLEHLRSKMLAPGAPQPGTLTWEEGTADCYGWYQLARNEDPGW